MSAAPTGTRTPSGIAITRRFDTPVEETWAWISDPDLTARWFGRWSGDPASGAVEVQLAAEEGAPTTTTVILECTAPRRLVTRNRMGWVVTLDVSADTVDGQEGSAVTLTQDMDDPELAAMVGPGWEFYLDRLVAARGGRDVETIAFEPGYVPGQSEHYRALVARG